MRHFILCLFLLVGLGAVAAEPPYQRNFVTTNSIGTGTGTIYNDGANHLSYVSLTGAGQLTVANGNLYIASGVLLTNTDSKWIFTTDNWDEFSSIDDHGIHFRHRVAPAGPVTTMFYTSDGEFHFATTGHPFFDYATPNTLVNFNVDQQPESIPNGAGFLANDGTGIFTYVPTNSITGIVEVSAIDIPMGAFFTNNIDSGIGATITAAQVGSITNAGDGMVFSHTNGTAAVTNVIRVRFALPWDWNGGTVKVGFVSICSGTNDVHSTNLVYAVRAAALGQGDDVSNPTFSSLVRTTNNVSINAWKQGSESITAALTIGNTPGSTKGILWEIQRHGGDNGDTETNFNCFLAQMRVYYQKNTRVDFPTSSP